MEVGENAEKETTEGRREERGMMGDKKKAVGVRGSSLRCVAEVLRLERRFESEATRGERVGSAQELCVAWSGQELCVAW